MKSYTKDNRVRFSLKTKLFLFVTLSCFLVIFVMTFYASVLSRLLTESSIKQSLASAENILSSKLESRFVVIEEEVKKISLNSQIRPMVYFAETSNLQDMVANYVKSAKSNLLIITDNVGQILAHSNNPEAVKSYVGDSAIFKTALSGKIASSFMKKGAQLYQIVVVPVFDNVASDLVKGSIAFASRLSEELAREIKNLTDSEVAYLTYESGKFDAYFSTFAGESKQIFANKSVFFDEENPGRNVAGKIFELKTLDDVYYFTQYPVRTYDNKILGFVISFKSKNELYAPYRKMIFYILIAGISCALIAGLLALVIARKVTEPILDLVEVTNQIESGFYPDAKEQGKGKDEVALISKAIFGMSAKLRKIAVVEDYLASLADDFSKDLSLDSVPISSKETSRLREGDKPPTELLEAGSIFDERYEILSTLGWGGIAVVYLAKDRELDEQVALKVFYEDDFGEDNIALTKNEVKLARMITHKNIVRIYDFGIEFGCPYISMEYVPGYTLWDFIVRNTPVSIGVGLVIAHQVASAIEAAHAQGVVHRDLKAENIMINRRGVIKVMDFGFAATISKHVTTGAMVKCYSSAEHAVQPEEYVSGTPEYMAPEIIGGGIYDHRVDIYAFGVILFFLFTGELPFKGDGSGDHEVVLKKHLSEIPVALSSINPNVSKDLDDLVAKMLEKERRNRFSSISEVREILNRWVSGKV